MVALFFKALFIGYSGAVMPGALLTYVINQSLKKGIKVGYLAILGHAILETILIVLIFLGLNAILSSNIMSIVISFVGGALLIYFGVLGIIEVLKKKMTVEIDENAKTDSDGKIVLSGGLISLANPYFIIWWAGIGMALLFESYKAFGYWGVLVFGIGHIMADLTWYLFISGMIHKTKGFLNKKAYSILAFALSSALVGFGIYYVISGFQFVGIL